MHVFKCKSLYTPYTAMITTCRKKPSSLCVNTPLISQDTIPTPQFYFLDAGLDTYHA